MTGFLARLSGRIPGVLRSARARICDVGRHHLALLHRRRLTHTTFIGITGTAGKTTTKNLSAEILSAHGRCHKTPGSANEHYDIEWTVLRTTRQHRFCVVEAGAPEPGYLDRALRVIRPHIGVLTLIAREHYSAYRSLEAIAAEKSKLLAALPSNGIAVLNIDDPIVRSIGERLSRRVIWIGQNANATIRLLETHSRWPDPLTLRIRFEEVDYEVPTQLHGTQLALSVLSALGVGVAAGLRFADAIHALALIEPLQGRMQVETADGVAFIRDDWKAPQWSFQAPLEFLRSARAQRKVAIIGSISDSPKSPSQRYAWAAKQALEVADLVVLIGAKSSSALKSSAAQEGRSLRTFTSIRDAAQFLKAELRNGDLVLLKGTNLQDHLVRLILDRKRPVQCWETSCGRKEFCGSCPRLYAPAAAMDANPPPSSSRAVGTIASEAVPLPCPLPIIVGLGNPGSRYRHTLHNVGHRALDALATSAESVWQQESDGWVTSALVDGREVTLFKPGVSVNDSGEAIRRFLAKRACTAEDCIVVLDDTDIRLGEVRAKRHGGDAGHKGMRSIIAALGTDAIPRIRIGVRPPGASRRANELVLERFSRDDEQSLAQGLDKADVAIREMIRMAFAHGSGTTAHVRMDPA
ncbi:MAG: aminoacyl-tRNA hydrolase [Burkholderiales bacterium]